MARHALYLFQADRRTRPVDQWPGLGRLPRKVAGERAYYFEKDAIGVGRYEHPVTGQRFSVTKKRLDLWAKKFARMQSRGIEIPTPVDHSDSAHDNVGFVVAMRRIGGRLRVLHQVIGDDAKKLAARNRVSVCIVPDFKDGEGRNWGEAIAHSAYTPKPVIHGQGAFMPIAASAAVNVPARKNKRVPVLFLSNSKEGQAMALRTKKMTTRQRLAKAVGVKASALADIDPGLLKRLGKLADVDRGTGAGKSDSRRLKGAKKKAKDDADDDDDDDADAEGADDATDDDDTDDDSDDDDTDAEDSEDDDSDDADDDDELDDDGHADDDDDDAEDSAPKGNRAKSGRQSDADLREPIAASMGRPAKMDAAQGMLVTRALKREARDAVKAGHRPALVEGVLDLFRSGKRLNQLALSAVPGTTDEPLAFHVLKLLRDNPPRNGGKLGKSRTGNQSLIALSRQDFPSGDPDDDGAGLPKAERKALAIQRKRDLAWAKKLNKKGK